MEIAEKKIVIFQTQDKYRNTVVNNSYQNDWNFLVSAWKWGPEDIQPSVNHTRQQDITNTETHNFGGEENIPTRSVMQLFSTNSAEKYSIILIIN